MYRSRLEHLPDYWDNSVAKFPNCPAAVDGGRTYTYSELDELIERVAAFMADACGVIRGDRVAIAMPNCVECLIAYWAAMKLGAIAAPVNIRLRDDELEFVLRNIGPKVVFVHEATPATLGGAISKCEGIQAVLVVGDPSGFDGAQAYEVAQAHLCRVGTDPQIQAGDVAVLLHTSGTTGEPKGALMTHETLHFNVKNAIFAHSFRHEDRHLLVIPFFAPTASYSLLASAAYQGSCICVAPRPDIGEIVELIQAQRCTTFIGVPTLFHLFVNGMRTWHLCA